MRFPRTVVENILPKGGCVVKFAWTGLILGVVTASSQASIYFAEDINQFGGTARGSRLQSDASHLQWSSQFSTIGTESFESRPVGALTMFPVHQFVGSQVNGFITNFAGGPAPHVEEILGTGVFDGMYPTDGNRYLRTGYVGTNTAVAHSFLLDFDRSVDGFGLYFTDIESSSPIVTVFFAAGGTQDFNLNTTQNHSGNIGFWGYADPLHPITSVALRNFGSSGDHVGLDYLQVGLVPEPLSMLVLSGSLFALGKRRMSATYKPK